MTEDDKTTEKSSLSREPLDYQDFNLRFSSSNGGYKVWAEGQTPGGGSMMPEDAVFVPYNPKSFWENPEEATGGMVGALDKRRISEEQVYELGKLLADHALPDGQVRKLFEQSLQAVIKEGQGLRLRLRIDDFPLAQIPWEFMCLTQASGEPKPSDFLALRREVSIVRTDTVEAPPPQLPAFDQVRIVAVLSSPDGVDELDLDKDKNAIMKAVNSVNKDVGKEWAQVSWIERPATRMKLDEALNQTCEIFLFGGHGSFDHFSNEGKIVLEKADFKPDIYEADKLALSLRDSKVRLAFMGACDTGRRDGKNVWSGMAPSLTREHVPAIVANQFKIRDSNATLLIDKTLHLILSGFTIDEAVFLGRRTIISEKNLLDRDWGTPVLYLREGDGILFPTPEVGEVGSEMNHLLRISVETDDVWGEVVGLEAFGSEGLDRGIDVKVKADTVKEGGKVTGAKLNSP